MLMPQQEPYHASCRQTWSVSQWNWASSNKNTLVACSVSKSNRGTCLGHLLNPGLVPVRLAGMRGAHRTCVTSLGDMDVLVRGPVRKD